MRAELRHSRGTRPAFDFGPEREAWDQVFDDMTMTELNALLMQLGTNVRSQRRRELFERVVPRLPEVGTLAMHDAIGDIAAARERMATEMRRLRTDLETLRS